MREVTLRAPFLSGPLESSAWRSCESYVDSGCWSQTYVPVADGWPVTWPSLQCLFVISRVLFCSKGYIQCIKAVVLHSLGWAHPGHHDHHNHLRCLLPYIWHLVHFHRLYLHASSLLQYPGRQKWYRALSLRLRFGETYPSSGRSVAFWLILVPLAFVGSWVWLALWPLLAFGFLPSGFW